MRNHARIRHAVAKRVLPLLDVARVDAGGSNANANFSGRWAWVRHFADHQHVASRSLLFVPRCLHLSSLEPVLHSKPPADCWKRPGSGESSTSLLAQKVYAKIQCIADVFTRLEYFGGSR